MTTTIWLDMDGTIADLYGVTNWLEMLIAHDPAPYALAAPIIRLSALAKLLNALQRRGFQIGIVSALAKDSDPDYDEMVINAKVGWLTKHLPSVDFDEMRFLPYEGVKNQVNNGNDILFDDEQRHHDAWTGESYFPDELLKVLRGLL